MDAISARGLEDLRREAARRFRNAPKGFPRVRDQASYDAALRLLPASIQQFHAVTWAIVDETQLVVHMWASRMDVAKHGAAAHLSERKFWNLDSQIIHRLKDDFQTTYAQPLTLAYHRSKADGMPSFAGCTGACAHEAALCFIDEARRALHVANNNKLDERQFIFRKAHEFLRGEASDRKRFEDFQHLLTVEFRLAIAAASPKSASQLRELILAQPDDPTPQTPEQIAKAQAFIDEFRMARGHLHDAAEKLVPGWDRNELTQQQFIRLRAEVCKATGLQPQSYESLSVADEIYWVREAARMKGAAARPEQPQRFQGAWYYKATNKLLTTDTLRQQFRRGTITGEMIGRRLHYDFDSVTRANPQYAAQLQNANRSEQTRTS